MKTLLAMSILAFGIFQFDISLSVDEMIVQHCYENNRAEVELFQVLTVSHPLGQNTCGEMHSIDRIGLDGVPSDVDIKVKPVVD